jgi:hypothetical protein
VAAGNGDKKGDFIAGVTPSYSLWSWVVCGATPRVTVHIGGDVVQRHRSNVLGGAVSLRALMCGETDHQARDRFKRPGWSCSVGCHCSSYSDTRGFTIATLINFSCVTKRL